MDAAPWLELLNSDWHDYRGSGRREDRLDDPRWLEGYLGRWVPKPDRLDRGTARRALRGLRDAMRAIVDLLVRQRKVRAEDRARLNAFLERVSYVRRIEAAGGKLALAEVPAGGPLEVALASIARSFAATLAEADISRLKICRNKDCLWVFLDGSRNKSRRWCETTCGNLMKVRRFRRRRKRARKSA
jgi:predicted RNA-binding Zn ribbon-like protein